MATSRFIYRVFAVFAVLDVVTLAYVQGRQAVFRTQIPQRAKSGVLHRYKPFLLHVKHCWLIYPPTFDANVCFRQPVVNLARDQKSRASLILVMMTLTYSATTVIRLTPFCDNLCCHKTKAQSMLFFSINTVNALYNYSA